MSEPVRKTLIGLTDLARSIADRKAKEQGFASLSEYLEWLILCQEFSGREVDTLFARRKKRGGRGGVHVLPNDAALPPEG